MSQKYEFPDDPIVFAQVLQHFRNMKATEWDARLDRYAREAHADAHPQEENSVVSVASETKKPEIPCKSDQMRSYRLLNAVHRSWQNAKF